MGILITCVVMSLFLYAGIYGLRGLNFILAPRMLKHMSILGGVFDAQHRRRTCHGSLPSGAFNGRSCAWSWLHRYPRPHSSALADHRHCITERRGLFISNYFGGFRLMAGSFSLWVIMVLLASLAFPALFQRFQVDPNEFEREERYIARNIEATGPPTNLIRLGRCGPGGERPVRQRGSQQPAGHREHSVVGRGTNGERLQSTSVHGVVLQLFEHGLRPLHDRRKVAAGIAGCQGIRPRKAARRCPKLG